MLYKTLLLAVLFLLPFAIRAQSKDEWIASLHYCESQDRDYITILDTNNKYSYGGLQFQFDTFYNFGKQYNILPDELTRKEALLLIHNPFIQKAIAREMLDDGLWRNWKNCTLKIGAYPLEET